MTHRKFSPRSVPAFTPLPVPFGGAWRGAGREREGGGQAAPPTRQLYVGMRGEGYCFAPFVKGKVRIPPPAGNSIDSPRPKIFLLTPVCHKKIFPILQVDKIKNVPQKCIITHILKIFQNSLKKLHFRAIFAILQYPSHLLEQKVLPPLQEKSPHAGPFSTPLQPPTTVPKYGDNVHCIGEGGGGCLVVAWRWYVG